MADDVHKTLGRLKEIDSWCDRYEHSLQNGERSQPADFLSKHGVDPQTVSAELLAELDRLHGAYRFTPTESSQSNTEVFKPTESKRVGRYELRRPLGSGGFGEVWVAFDPQLDREIAIKIPHKGVLGDAAAIERFYREAKSAAKLKHTNIVRVHDAGSDGSTHFIAAEFIAGRTLRELCSADGMEIREAVRIVADLAGAVYYAHRNQIVHRDIKPGNVLMDANNQPHLTDFGLASQLDASALTTNGTVMGTPIYMAPEQAAGRFGTALPACDQYSLGTVLYELLTGRPPFSGSNSVVLYHKLNTAPPAPRTIRPEIPAEVEAVCLRAMERIPERRYPDCEAMAAELRNWLAGNTKPKSVRARLWISSAVVITAVILFGAAAAIMYRIKPEAKQKDDAIVIHGDDRSPFVPTPPVEPKTKEISLSQPSTPKDAEILEAEAQLPLHYGVSRKIVEFNEIHGADLNTVLEWTANLGPDYLPSVIGEHATAQPKQYHVIAYRLSFPVSYRTDAVRSLGEESKLIEDLGKKGYRAVGYAEQLYGNGPDGEFLRTTVQDNDYTYVLIGNHSNFFEHMTFLKTNGFRPIDIIPKMSHDGGSRLIMALGAHSRTNWEADQLMTADDLKAFAEKSRAEKRFLFEIRPELTPEKQLRFYAIALENPDNRDWDYRLDMTTAEYESELVRRKALGFRPTTVTSYGDAKDPRYAAAWIRYFNPAE